MPVFVSHLELQIVILFLRSKKIRSDLVFKIAFFHDVFWTFWVNHESVLTSCCRGLRVQLKMHRTGSLAYVQVVTWVVICRLFL